MIKKFICFVLIIFMTTPVYAAERRYNVNISDGTVFATKGDFYFKIPISWENYIDVYKTTDSARRYIEKYDFYYLPKDINNYKSLFFSFYIYDINNWAVGEDEEVLIKSDKYVITIFRRTGNYYETTTDKIIFDRFLSEIWTNNFISSKFIGIDTSSSENLTITVSGIRLKDRAIKNGGIVYVPLRAICDSLNYSIAWDPKTSSVMVNNSISIGKLSNKSGDYNAKIISNKTYVPIVFLVNKLKLNVDIDTSDNIKISK